MEEKLTKLIIATREFSRKDDKYFIEITYSGIYDKLEISVREKETYEFIETRDIYLDKLEMNKIDELLEYIKNY